MGEMAQLGITDRNLAGQLSKHHVQGHYLEVAYNDLSNVVRDHRDLTDRHTSAFQEILTKLTRLEQQVSRLEQQGAQGGYRKERSPAELRSITMRCLLQPPIVWTMTGNTTQDFVSWRSTLETKLKTAAVDLLRDRAVINSWIWSLLDKQLQNGAKDLRPYLYDQASWHEYVDLIEEKFAPANIRSYNIYLFKATKQKETQTVLEFHGDLQQAYERAGYTDQMIFYDQFLEGCINEKLQWKIIEDNRTRSISGMRQFLVEAQAKFLDAGKYIKDARYTQGLHQFSKHTNQFIQRQLKPRSKTNDHEPMDLSEISEDLPFFQHSIDSEIWHEETQDEKEYWEEEGGEGMLLALSNQDPSGKTCFHCKLRGHFKATCPQRRAQGLSKRRGSAQKPGGGPPQRAGSGTRGGGPRETKGAGSHPSRSQPRRPQINSVGPASEDPEYGATLALEYGASPQGESAEAQPQGF